MVLSRPGRAVTGMAAVLLPFTADGDIAEEAYVSCLHDTVQAGLTPAVNMDTGDIAYRKTLGVTDAFPPNLQNTGRPSTGGPILTASGLTFVGGTDDFRFRAFATATGEKLWEVKLPSSIEATPVTYMGADQRQFVAVVSTGGSLTGSDVTNDEIIAFAVPKNPPR